jgi:hypothetical protein
MPRITEGIEGSFKIIDYSDDWMVHTTHQHHRVATIRIQKAAMNRIIKLVDDTGLKVLTEKTKAIMFRMNIWAKGEKIEQARQNRILVLTFDTRMNWLEHIKNTKARVEKDKYN